MSAILSVSQLNRYLSFKFKEDKNLRRILIKGEISNFTNHNRTGHFYFSIKDESSMIGAVMFQNFASRVSFLPKNGMKVIISADVNVYEKSGNYQLYVTEMQPDGIGEAYLRFEQLKEKLLLEGLFDNSYKKKLPAYPEKIAIVTSLDAAALQDMLRIISERYEALEVEIYPCLVQGENAVKSIVSAIKLADYSNSDAIIVGRGGGSFEDLSAFNSEEIARAIFAARTPIISAVGHETDTSISDYVADFRAETPSAAAVAVVPDMKTVLQKLDDMSFTLQKLCGEKISDFDRFVKSYELKLSKFSIENRLKNIREKLSHDEKRLNSLYQNKITINKALVLQKIELLDSLSPLKVLERGFSLAYKDGKIVNSASKLKTGDRIEIAFSDDKVSAEII